ncbi:invasion associated locus B family protein [Methylovirgula sp. 4M-Z18]|uniref:invasion associated locus B family protein n=1 Tax=Methylovirgula sp. 4M-Z18 TaxID=2293567 RepID=UPI001314CC31|nr:invasion associated locus B family protein [Methylovirgula sp. 4M-Z18]
MAALCIGLTSSFAFAQSSSSAPIALPATTGLSASNTDNKGEQWATTAYGDWILRCKASPTAGGKKTCEIVQQLLSNNVIIAEIAFGSVAASSKPSAEVNMVVVLPNNVLVTEPVQASPDENDKTPLKLPFKRCLPSGCFASLPLSPELLSRWKQSNHRGRIAFMNGSNQDVALPFSCRGLSDALEAMAKS